MTATTFTAPGPGPVVFGLDAPAAYAEITVSPDAATASAVLSGPAEVVSAARVAASGARWTLALPRTPAADGSVIVQSAGSVIIGGTFTGAIRMTRGRVIVKGVDVTAAVAAAAPEPVRLAVTLPAGSAVAAEVGAGMLTVRGERPAGEVATTSADVDIETTEDVRVRTVSGDITARTVASSADLRSVSGDIGIDATAGPVTAGTTSGDIRVTAGPGVCPDVRARSVSGRVRTGTAGGAR